MYQYYLLVIRNESRNPSVGSLLISCKRSLSKVCENLSNNMEIEKTYGNSEDGCKK